MCDPASIFMGANVGVSLFGASQSAAGAAEGAQFQAQQAMLKSQIADANARMAMIEASGQMGRVARKVDTTIGQQRAAFAAQGLDPNQGSPLLTQAYTAAQGAIDQNLIAARGLSEQAGYRYEAAGALQQRDQALAAGKYGVGTAWLGGIGSSLKGLSGMKWGSFDDIGKGISSFGADLAGAWG